MALLEAKHLAKSYKKRPVVKDVSIAVESGQAVGLLGPNGAGKTTCFYMIVGMVANDAGGIFIDGQDITKDAMHTRAQKCIGYLPQEASIFRKMSVEDNILAILETRKELSKAQQNEKLETLLEEFHITHIRSNLVMALSGGERRRVEIARALALNPKFIFLDEPFAGVASISVGDIQLIIKRLQASGIGVLITDHNVRETLDICDKAYIVGNGYIIASGDANTVINNEQVKQVYLGDDFRL